MRMQRANCCCRRRPCALRDVHIRSLFLLLASCDGKCPSWCSPMQAATHCNDHQCAACDFCLHPAPLALLEGTCEPLPFSDDISFMKCASFCTVSSVELHCKRCDCQLCTFCPRAEKLADRETAWAKCGQRLCAKSCSTPKADCGRCECSACQIYVCQMWQWARVARVCTMVRQPF